LGRKISNILLSLVMVLSLIMPNLLTVQASTDYVVANRNNPATLVTNGEAEVTLNIQGTPPVNVVRPNDVVLVIDKSGSMQNDNRMQAAKDAAKGFVDMMDFTKHRIGIVDYSDRNLTQSLDLNVDAAATKSYVDAIRLGGGTGTDIAIQKGMDLLANRRPEAQPVMVLLTDGEAQNPDAALQQAKIAKDAGIVFYTVALLGQNDKPDGNKYNELLEDMATTAQHHHFVLGSTGLKEAYDAIVKEIGMASATDVVVTETISPELEIVPGSYDNNIPKPTVSGNTLMWNFLELKDQPLNFTYKVRAKQGTKAGKIPVVADSKITYKDYTGASRTYNINKTDIEVVEPAPIITTIVEAQGKIGGGEKVVINGEYFQNGVTVTFNGNNAPDVIVENSQKITVTAPAGLQGDAEVVVRNPDAQTAKVKYKYIADPVVNSISPGQGPFEGGNTVIIYGNYFLNGIKVSFGDIEVPNVDFKNSTNIRVVVPKALQAGAVDLKLTNPDGTSIVIPNGYKYDEPIKDELEITNVSPNEGFVKGGELVHIEGNKFKADSEIFFGSEKASLATFYSDKKIRVVAPKALQEGKVDITIKNSDATTTTLKDAYNYIRPPLLPLPEVTSINPNKGLVTGGELVTIEGKNFVNDMKVYFGDIETKIDVFYSSSKIRVKTPASNISGPVDIKIKLPDEQEITVPDAYIYEELPPPPPPSILSLSSTSGELAGGELIYVNGKNFQEGVKVYIGAVEATVLNFYGSERLRIKVPASTKEGSVDVTVENPDGETGVIPDGYTYLAPPPPPPLEITLVTPNEGISAGGELVYIEGKNIDRSAEVLFGSTAVKIDSYYSSNRIRVKAPSSNGYIGNVDITITNPDGGTVTLSNAYTYKAVEPKITKISASSGELIGGELIYLDGEHFDPGVKVTVGGNVSDNVTFYSSSRIRVKIPASAIPGTVKIVVENPDGATASVDYTYKDAPITSTPEITKISASSGTAGNLIYIDGKNFDPNMVIDIGGVQFKVLTYYGTERVRVRMPAMGNGIYEMKIINPGGKESNKVMFEYK
jgi:von Willebrand factor type A domain/IPT/TIG domain